ncbi:hypothetical protein QF000_004123 [Paraburkholderia atlantica]
MRKLVDEPRRGHAQRLAFDVGHALQRVGRLRRDHFDFARHLAEDDQRLHFLALALQIDRVIVEADHALHGTREQFVLRVDTGRLRQDFDVEAFVLEVAELLGELGRQIDDLGGAADHDRDLLGMCCGRSGSKGERNT